MKMELTFYSPTGEPVVLTLDEARELYILLAELFQEKNISTVANIVSR